MLRSVLFFVLIALASITSAQSALDLSAPIPFDPAIRTGVLDNGIHYFIRKNKKPENRMELRLAVNAGSVLEDDDQQGLAHFCEHMAFNGSEHFKKNDLVNYLESIGVKFGPDLNAYTSFDETVYMLQLPTDTASIVDKGFTVLSDWAHGLSFEDEEIDKERGVVIEEWRLGRGAEARMDDKQFPILFQGSKYAERLPIGKKPILETFKYDAARRFYKEWYRPELMAVIASGDFDVDKIEAEIKAHFAPIPKSTGGRERVAVPVPDVAETRYAIATDPEASRSAVSVMFKLPVQPIATLTDYRARLIQNLYNRMFNGRLDELTQKADPPFLYANGARFRYVRNAEFYAVEAGVNNGGIERGLEALLTEVARVKQFGFTVGELEREKKAMLRSIDQRYDERDKTDSRVFVGQLVGHFLNHEPVPGMENERKFYHELVPGITLKEINRLATVLITENNRIISTNSPEKEGVPVPTKEGLAAVFAKVQTVKLMEYDDRTVSTPLVEHLPAPQPVKAETTIPELGITEWMLANDVRVILKPTDFKNDEIMMSAFRPGGTSVSSDDDYISASEAARIVDESGIGNFDPITLRKALAGKIASVSPYFTETHDRMQGSASPKDLQTMLEMTYLYFTAPRKDSAVFQSFITKERGSLQNRSSEPSSAFDDTLEVTLNSYHPRRQPFTEATLSQIHLDRAMEFYKQRFADASGFTFVFVGNFEPAKIKPMIEQYLGALPAMNRPNMWKDVGVHFPTGVIEKAVHKGLEQKSQVRIVFSGPFTYTPEDRWRIQSLCSVLSIHLREELREEKGGVYGVWAYARPSHQPRDEYSITIGFPCAPNRVNELTKLALAIVDSVKQNGVSETYIQKVRETQLRERESALKQNQFWISAIPQFYQNGEDMRVILKYNDMVKTMSSDMIRDAARKYLNTTNYVQVAQFPEK